MQAIKHRERVEMTAKVFIDGEVGTTGLQIKARLEGRGDIELLHLAESDRKNLDRKRDMLTSLIGGKCRVCGTAQFPKSNVCVSPNCGAFRSQDDHPFADIPASIQSWTADTLTYSPDPPHHFGMVVFDEGGRLMVDLTDVDEGAVEVGMPMRMVFRIKEFDDQRGFTKYFWKATPALG